MTRRRGGTAIRRDLFAPLPAEGSWEQILLTDGNIGIGGNPVRILRRAARPPRARRHRHRRDRSRGNCVLLRTAALETERHLGHWFPWSRMGADALDVIAHAAGFMVTHVVDIHDRMIAVLRGADRGGVDR